MIQLAAGLARHLTAIGESRPDGELLAAFLAHRDEDAFAELVRRHGSLVWSACRRLLPDATDAEDAFQTSFLLLVRRARRLTNRNELGPWLYQVAVWTSRNIRRRNARILSKRKPLTDSAATSPAPELHVDLDAALAALPEKFRAPLVLCHLQGWSRRDAAARLGCPEGTLSSLLARGLDRLRAKLPGFDPAKPLGVAAAAVPLLLAKSTVSAAAGASAAGVVSVTVHQLVEGAIRMFWIKKATAASVALFAVFGFGMGIGVSVKQVPGATAGDGPPAAVAGSGVEEALLALHAAENELKRAYNAGDEDALQRARIRVQVSREVLLKAEEQHEANRKTVIAAGKLAKLKVELAAAEKRILNIDSKLPAALRQLADAEASKNKDAIADETQLVARLTLDRTESVLLRRQLQTQIERMEADLKAAPRDDRTAAQLALDVQIERLKREQEEFHAEAIMLAMKREGTQRLLADLEAKRAEANRTRPAAVAASAATIDLTINPATASVPFKVTELNENGKPVGTLTFDNFEILSRYLTRTGKDGKAPRSVRLIVQADTKFEVIKQIVEACAAAGLKPPATLYPSGPRIHVPKLGEKKTDSRTEEDDRKIFEWYMQFDR